MSHKFYGITSNINTNKSIIYKIQKISQLFPNEQIEFVIHSITKDLQLYIIQKNEPMRIMIIKKHQTIPEIKKYIDSKLSIENSKECGICANENVRCNFFCLQCNYLWCIQCYISIMATKDGRLICPFCCHKYGKKVSDSKFEKYAEQLQNSFYSCLRIAKINDFYIIQPDNTLIHRTTNYDLFVYCIRELFAYCMPKIYYEFYYNFYYNLFLFFTYILTTILIRLVFYKVMNMEKI